MIIFLSNGPKRRPGEAPADRRAHAFGGAAAGGEVGGVALDPLEAVLEVGQVIQASGGEVVQHSDALGLSEQGLDRVRVDEAGAPGHEGRFRIVHRSVPIDVVVHGEVPRGQARTMVALGSATPRVALRVSTIRVACRAIQAQS